MLPKKSKSTKCEEYRTVSIWTHTYEILTKIILGRIEKKIEENLAEDQFGFRKNRGTREAILCLRNVVEKSFKVNKKMYIAFVGLQRAVDCVNRNVMMKILKMINTDYRVRRIIRELYKHQTTSLKIKESKREAVIRKEVRQGCNLSPLLSNIYIEQAVNECKHCNGIKVNGVGIQMVRFTDDIVIVAKDEIHLKRTLDSSDDILKINYKIETKRIKQKLWSAPKILKILILKLTTTP